MKRLLLLILLAGLGALAWWIYRIKSEPPRVPFAKARRETLVSTLPTNGKVEPIEWSAARADAAGLVTEVPVHEGQQVAAGAVLAVLSDTAARTDISAAEARVAQAHADLATLQAGGKSAELAEIESTLEKARFDRAAGQREYEALARLAQKQAVAPVQVEAARRRVEEADLQIQAQERRRAALVAHTDVSVAQARLKEATAALETARARAAKMVIRAPIAGVVYGLAVRAGAYVEPGGLIANVGHIERLRVHVYVDEPELGRVETGQPVTITWDGLPGKQWTGAVERKATEIEALGTRQVGEVLCATDNPGRELLPGANVNAEIRTSVVERALTIPKEALRREGAQAGVYVLDGDTLAWRSVTTGAGSLTRIEITGGLAEGDAVALPTEVPLRAGLRVRPS